jgi:hypothetical protein
MSASAKIRSTWDQIEKTIASLKFAVIIIAVFSLAMIIGTFVESYFGTEFAGRTVYKTGWFMGLQALMFLSILFAALHRLPPKKRLYGFYTIHAGLITIGMGSLVTYVAGVDGAIFLPPNEPSREVILHDDLLRIHLVDEGRIITTKLPSTAFKTQIDESWEDIKLLSFLPYSKRTFGWRAPRASYGPHEALHSSRYELSNPNVTQEFFLTLNPEAQGFDSTVTMGPLTVHYLPKHLSPCFDKTGPSRLILWNRNTGECFTPEQRKIEIKKSGRDNRFLVVQEGDRLYSFFPDVSPWPMTDQMQVDQDSPLRVFSQNLFESKPNLFVFGETAGYFDRDEKHWVTGQVSKTEPLSLPWMGLQIVLLEHRDSDVPEATPEYTIPIQKNGQVIKGNERALEVEVRGERYWVSSEQPLTLMVDGKRRQLMLVKESLLLPFEFVLTQFKMDKDPGTNSPASYESFVRLFTEDGPQEHHVYMNNPMKYEGFTFYQASYSQDSQGNYSSTLSANVDPGRAIKYLGSLMLVLGAIAHYFLNYRKVAAPEKPLIS